GADEITLDGVVLCGAADDSYAAREVSGDEVACGIGASDGVPGGFDPYSREFVTQGLTPVAVGADVIALNGISRCASEDLHAVTRIAGDEVAGIQGSSANGIGIGGVERHAIEHIGKPIRAGHIEADVVP